LAILMVGLSLEVLARIRYIGRVNQTKLSHCLYDQS
jgi:hypothetical protein